jgi:hypothetical protein
MTLQTSVNYQYHLMGKKKNLNRDPKQTSHTMNRNKPRLRFDYRLFAANDKQQLPEILH